MRHLDVDTVIDPGSIYIGLIERLGYGRNRTEPYIELTFKDRDGFDHVHNLSLETAGKLHRRLGGFLKAAKT